MRRTAVKLSRIQIRGANGNKPRWWSDAPWKLATRVSVASLFLLALVLGSSQANAQSVTSGDIVGLVTDPSGAIVTGANVTLKNSARGNTQVQSTNSHGTYRFSLLEPGSYVLSVAAPGFQGAKTSAEVSVGQATTVNLVLALSTATETVEVTTQAPLLQTENANVSTNFDQTQISQVPNPGNDLS